MMQSGEMATLGERVAQAGREGSVSGERCGERGEIPTGVGGTGETTERTSGARVAVTEGKA
jgi:hypothetical protein